MPAIGFFPAPKFNVLRSYVRRFYCFYGGDDSTTVMSLSANVAHLHYAVPGFFFDTYITLLPSFVAWSSNCYSLDFIVQSEYSLVNGAGAPILSNYLMASGWDLFQPGLYVTITYAGGANYFHVDLPTNPDYWLQFT
jgi:hypothetical protein